MAKYRLIEVSDQLINRGRPFWRVQKYVFPFGWTEYFGCNDLDGSTYYDYQTALGWYNHYTDKSSRIQIKVLLQNK